MRLLLAVAASVATLAAAPAADPAATRIEAFDPALLDAMKHAKALGLDGRAEKLRPAIEQLFAFDTMAQFTAGPQWAAMTPADRHSVVEALSRYTVRNFAHNFKGFSGEQFSVDPVVKTHGLDKLVKTTITAPGSAPDTLMYRMREYSGAWKVVDIYYNGISQVTLLRSQLASAMAGGAPALVRALDKQTQALN